MIEPTEKDIGRNVVYRPRPGVQGEDGVIRSFNDSVVHVLYRGDLHAKATDRRDLFWPFDYDRV